jgi:RNA polymerase sigma-54 factor
MPKLSQTQELRQQLTPRQILQASLLQLNLPLMEQRILHELEINPALEMIELTDDAYEEESQDIDETKEEEEEKEDVEFEWEELLGEHEDFENPSIANNDQEKPDIPIIYQESFSDLYLQQLQDSNATSQELIIAEEVLGNLNTQGYLTIEPMLISDRLELEQGGTPAYSGMQHPADPGAVFYT